MNVEVKSPGRNLSNPYGLTNKEIEVIKLYSSKLSSTIIAEKLSISTNTLKKHRQHIYRKIKVNTIHQVCCLAFEMGMV